MMTTIFKENGKVSQRELDVIRSSVGDYNRYNDEGVTWFEVYTDYKTADDLVDDLNIYSEKGEWYVEDVD